MRTLKKIIDLFTSYKISSSAMDMLIVHDTIVFRGSVGIEVEIRGEVPVYLMRRKCLSKSTEQTTNK